MCTGIWVHLYVHVCMWKPVLVCICQHTQLDLFIFFNMGYRTNSSSKVLYQLSHIPSLLPIYYFEMVSHILGWLWTYYVAKDGLELLNFQPLPPKSCEYRHVPPHPIYKILGTEPRSVVGIKPRASNMLDKTLSIKSYSHALFFIFSTFIYNMHLEIRGQPAGVDSPPCGS